MRAPPIAVVQPGQCLQQEQSNAHRTVLMDFRTSTRFTSSTASNGEQHAMLPIHQIEF